MHPILWTIVLACLLIQFALLQSSQESRSDARHLLSPLLPPPTVQRHKPGSPSRQDSVPVVLASFASQKDQRVVAVPTRLLRKPGLGQMPIEPVSLEGDHEAARAMALNHDPNDRIPQTIYAIVLHEEHNLDDRRSRLNEAAEKYRKAWRIESTPTIRLLTDDDCLHYVNETEPRLSPYYQSLSNDAQKSSLCRLVILYSKGGYVLDADATVVEPWIPDSACTFGAARHSHLPTLSSLFLAMIPKHEHAKVALELLVEHHVGNQQTAVKPFNMDAEHALYAAFHKLGYDTDDSLRRCMLEESDLDDPLFRDLYPSLPRRSIDCNSVVHDRTRVYLVAGPSNCGSKPVDIS